MQERFHHRAETPSEWASGTWIGRGAALIMAGSAVTAAVENILPTGGTTTPKTQQIVAATG